MEPSSGSEVDEVKGSGDGSDAVTDVTRPADPEEYEKQRQANIARNQTLMAAMGLQAAAAPMAQAGKAASKPKKRKAPAAAVPTQPTRRRSSRPAALKAREKLVELDTTTDFGGGKSDKEDGDSEEDSQGTSTDSDASSAEDEDEAVEVEAEEAEQPDDSEAEAVVVDAPASTRCRGRGRGRAKTQTPKPPASSTRGRGRGRGRGRAGPKPADKGMDEALEETEHAGVEGQEEQMEGEAPLAGKAKSKKAPVTSKKAGAGRKKGSVVVQPTQLEVELMFEHLAEGKKFVTMGDLTRAMAAFAFDTQDGMLGLMMKGAYQVTGVAEGGNLSLDDFTQVVATYLTV